ncbi:acetate/propionate family kinase [Polynucleobacter sp. UB-Tiil-W10]|uniref:acetate/propionate family kinase n=1 Tax=Polynucleobacter sp. UB-Tiil-W10 TaxID=1855648 RepID=UPI001C0C8A89|nr:acetate/propionate family kinase [Polynucleobacter sp. UB-Tiil-W10]MBU3541009.1 acetate/propionate family kinase [Polynucleobacter sp. UB-Tiil-W10]
MAILTVNAGSSSLKFSIYPTLDGSVLPSVLSGSFEGLEPGGKTELRYAYKGAEHAEHFEDVDQDPFIAALLHLKELLLGIKGLPAIRAVSHRIVHGGSEFFQPIVSTDAILEKLSAMSALAPLHQPHSLDGVRAFSQVFPGIPQVLCFDTAFHKTMSALETSLALPKEITDQGVRRYGFHGISYQYIIGDLMENSKRARDKVLMAHLGNGASLCAAIDGKSVATTMGFSALDGLMMGTRSGSLDAGVLMYLVERGYTHDRLQDLLYRKSGLLGVSTISADMRKLRASSDPLAKEAIELFIYKIIREGGAMIGCLGGLDLISFSGGIGEHDPFLRSAVCKKLAWLGVEIDEKLNQEAMQNLTLKISTPQSRVEVWVVPTDEGVMTAQEAVTLLHI